MIGAAPVPYNERRRAGAEPLTGVRATRRGPGLEVKEDAVT
jgi:hypothetical protein